MTSRRSDSVSIRRCAWCGDDPLYIAYHDREWGFPVTDDCRLFEKICLEGFQAGLSWRTILAKRESFRAAFHGFDVARVARFTARDVERLLSDASIVRHRGKIESTINNAKRAREMAAEFGSLAAFFWRHEPGPATRPRRLTRDVLATMSTSPESVALSKDLKKRGLDVRRADDDLRVDAGRWGSPTTICTIARCARRSRRPALCSPSR